jgi:outer membrane protein assembly factor BamB
MKIDLRQSRLFAPVLLTWLLLGLLSLTAWNSSWAEDWPSWRGPRGDGSSLEQELPVEWNAATGKNILWKAKLPGKGHSSPIIWQNRVFLTTCMEVEQKRLLICLDAGSGEQLWQCQVLQSPLESVHKLNSHASGTPATDGNLVYVPFLQVDGKTMVAAPNVGNNHREITPGKIVLSAIDFHGELRWQVDVGDFVSAHGFCSCPVLYGNLVILNGDHDGKSYLAAYNKITGQEVWRTQRAHGIRSYVTPIIRKINARDQLMLAGSSHVAGFDVSNGNLLWNVEGPTEQFVASMVYDGERVMLAAGFPTHHLMAIRPNGLGNVTDSHVAWHVDKHVKCYVPSPVLVGHQLFVADDRGTASCFDSTSGERIWQGRLSEAFNASLVATDRYVYFLDRDGVTTIVEPGTELKVIATNPLQEPCSASPAISNGRMFIRGDTHLFCIGSK